MRKFDSENGSYTIEACISLFFFLITVYFVFLLVNTLIVESVLQKAANNIAKEVAGFTYILDRAGLIVKHDENEMETSQNIIDSGKNVLENTDKLTGLMADLYNSGDLSDVGEQTKSTGESLSEFVKLIGNLDLSTVKDQGVKAARYAAEEAVKSGVNNILSSYCDYKISSYLPSKSFCDTYGVVNLSFENSKFMPTINNNSVYIVASCEIKSPFNISGLDLFSNRKVVKTAYALLWVDTNEYAKK